LTLQRIVLKALSKQPEQRFQTAEEMTEALETFLTSYTGKNAESSMPKRDLEESHPRKEHGQDPHMPPLNVTSDTGLYRDLQQKNSPKKQVSFSIKNKPSPKMNHENKVDIRKIINDDLKMDPRSKEPEITQENEVTKEKPTRNATYSKEKEVYEETQRTAKVDSTNANSPTFSMKHSKKDSGGTSTSPKKRYWLPVLLIGLAAVLLFFIFGPLSGSDNESGSSSAESTFLEWVSPQSVKEVFLSPLVPTSIVLQNPSWEPDHYYTIKKITPTVDYTISKPSEDGVFTLKLFSSNPNLEKTVQFTIQYRSPADEVRNEVTYTIANTPDSVSEIRINYEKATYSLNNENPQMNDPNVFIYQEKVYIPIRFLYRVFDADLSYDFEEEKIEIRNLDQHVYEFYLFQNKYAIDGQTITGVNPVLEINDTAYLPIDFLSIKMRFSVVLERNIDDHFVIRLIKNQET
jgi:hypothetical protein